MTTQSLPTVLLITYPSSVLFGMVPTMQICRHVATLTYDKNILLPFRLLTPRTSLFGRVHQTNVQEAHWRPCRTLTVTTALSFPLWSRGEDALLPAAF